MEGIKNIKKHHWLPPQPNDFCKKSTRVGPNSEGTASGCSDSHKVAENKKREAWANARWIGMKKSPVDFSIARKGGELLFLRFAIETFTECFFISRQK